MNRGFVIKLVRKPLCFMQVISDSLHQLLSLGILFLNVRFLSLIFVLLSMFVSFALFSFPYLLVAFYLKKKGSYMVVFHVSAFILPLHSDGSFYLAEKGGFPADFTPPYGTPCLFRCTSAPLWRKNSPQNCFFSPFKSLPIKTKKPCFARLLCFVYVLQKRYYCCFCV